jgi:hypothetical protein
MGERVSRGYPSIPLAARLL